LNETGSPDFVRNFTFTSIGLTGLMPTEPACVVIFTAAWMQQGAPQAKQ
jgi:hypothetical protein